MKGNIQFESRDEAIMFIHSLMDTYDISIHEVDF